jgi:hypothetical protein
MTTLCTRTGHHLISQAECPEHAWTVESSHRISTGTVHYNRCVLCGVRRVEQQDHQSLVPTATSREIR